jgi:hypothetical protein
MAANGIYQIAFRVDPANAAKGIQSINKEMRSLQKPANDIKKSLNEWKELSGLNAVTSDLGKVKNSIENVLSSVVKLTLALGGVSGALSIAGFVSELKQAGDYAQHIRNLGLSLGHPKDTLQTRQFINAGKITGASEGSIESALLAQNQLKQDVHMGKQDNATMQKTDFLRRAGIASTKEEIDKMSPEELFDKQMKYFKKMKPGANRDAAMTQQGFDPSQLNKTVEDWDKAKETSAKITMVNQKDLDDLDQMTTDLQTLKVEGTEAFQSVAAAFAPLVGELVHDFGNWLNANKGEIKAWAEGVATAIHNWYIDPEGFTKLKNEVIAIWQRVEWVVDLLGGWKNTLRDIFVIWASLKVLSFASHVLSFINNLRTALGVARELKAALGFGRAASALAGAGEAASAATGSIAAGAAVEGGVVSAIAGVTGTLLAGLTISTLAALGMSWIIKNSAEALADALGVNKHGQSSGSKGTQGSQNTGAQETGTTTGTGAGGRGSASSGHGHAGFAKGVERTALPTMDRSNPVDLARKQQYVYDSAIKMGLSKAEASGMVAGLTRESQLNEKAVGDGGHAIGIGQHHEDRQKKIAEHLNIKNYKDASFEQQVEGTLWEYLNSDTSAHKHNQGVNDNYTAGSNISKYYERPAAVNGEADSRGKLAQQLGDHLEEQRQKQLVEDKKREDNHNTLGVTITTPPGMAATAQGNGPMMKKPATINQVQSVSNTVA